MERHWKQFAKEININNTVLQKRLADFCLKLIDEIDNTYADFINRYQRDSLLDDIITNIKKRTHRTLKQLE